MRPLLTLLFLAITLCTRAQNIQLVHDIEPDTSSYPFDLRTFNGKLFFTATTSPNGRELWSYNGSGVAVREFDQYGIDPVLIDYFNCAVMNGKLYFGGNGDPLIGDELMVYDGINPPTVVADIIPGAGSSAPRNFYSYDGKLYFAALTPGDGIELFVYDGVNPPVAYDISPYFDQGVPLSSFPAQFTELNGKIYFSVNKIPYGFELLVYDPTQDTVGIAADIAPGGTWGQPYSIMRSGNELYFSAQTVDHGRELYSFDGTTLTRLTDLASGPDHGVGGVAFLREYNGYLYFNGTEFNGLSNHVLFRYDLNTGDASMVDAISASDGIVYGNKFYVTVDDNAHGHELYVHDGANTTLVTDLYPGTAQNGLFNSGDPSSFHIYNNILYFSANTEATGYELYSLSDPAANVIDAKLSGEVSVSPNPTTGDAILHLSLRQAKVLGISITDVAGKLIYQKETSSYPAGYSDVLLPVGQQAAGVYFYNVKDNNGKMMASGKLVKE